MIRNRTDIKNLGTIMCVFAHPDDETFTMGGIMAAAAKNGQRVICVTATRGEKGMQDERRWPADELAGIRTTELEAALQILGVSDHIIFDYPDGGCTDQDDGEAIKRLEELIERYRPDSIFSFGPDGLTGHPDHSATSRWALLAAHTSARPLPVYHAVLTDEQYARTQAVDAKLNFFYNTPKPPTCRESEAAVCLRLAEELLGLKLRALQAMPSQYLHMFNSFDEATIRGCFNIEAFMAA